MNSKFALFPLFLGLMPAGCASGPALEKYPRREIERPYTLPKGVATWETWVDSSYEKANTGSDFQYPIPIPLIWRQSLSDDWNLLWIGVPLGVQYQALHSTNHRVGISGMVAELSLGGFHKYFKPRFTFDYRIRVYDFLAFNVQGSYLPIIGTQSSGVITTRDFGLGPLFQVSDILALALRIQVVSEEVVYSVRNTTNSNSFVLHSGFQEREMSEVFFPVQIWGGWSFSRQWEVAGQYKYYSKDFFNSNLDRYEGQFVSHEASIQVIHSW